MNSKYYSAVWTDSGFLLGCSHEHKTVADAASCIPCAGGYVVGVENTVTRALARTEEAEFQCAIPSHSADKPVETISVAPAEAVVSGPGYAVMVRIRVIDHWTWTTWMRFETYAEAAANAREGNEVVHFQSPEWVRLRQESEPASPIAMKAPRETVLPQSEGETLLEFVLRLLRAFGFAQHIKLISQAGRDSLNTDWVDSGLNHLSDWETNELQKLYAEDRRVGGDARESMPSCPKVQGRGL